MVKLDNDTQVNRTTSGIVRTVYAIYVLVVCHGCTMESLVDSVSGEPVEP